jgi:hypothetical protein
LSSTGRVKSKGINVKIKAKNEHSLKGLGNTTTKRASEKKNNEKMLIMREK